MQLDEKARQNALNRLKDIWPSRRRKCVVCGNNKFEMMDKIFQLSEYFEGVLVSGPIIPCVVVTCTKCGNSLLFNAIKLGVYKPKKLKSKPL